MMILVVRYNSKGHLTNRVPLEQQLEKQLAPYFKEGQDILELTIETTRLLQKHNVDLSGDCVLERWTHN